MKVITGRINNKMKEEELRKKIFTIISYYLNDDGDKVDELIGLFKKSISEAKALGREEERKRIKGKLNPTELYYDEDIKRWVLTNSQFMHALKHQEQTTRGEVIKEIEKDLEEVKNRAIAKLPKEPFYINESPYQAGFMNGASECIVKLGKYLPDRTRVQTLKSKDK